jgi:arylsulfatase A-like enzyme
MALGGARPNVLVFFTDQQRWDTTGVHGNPLGLTPNFDRCAASGTHVYNSFTVQPVCAPARACLQTGMYATAHGTFTNAIPLDPSLPTLASCFGEGGYRTGYIGKWHLAEQNTELYDQRPVPADQRGGYDYWLAANLLEFCSDAYQTTLFDEHDHRVRLPGYRVDAIADATIRFLQAHTAERPFFLFTSYLEPHHQNHSDDYPAPTGYREMFENRWTPPDLAALGGSAQQHLPGYYGMVKRLDEAFGRVLDALRSLDLLDSTVVLFTSDHGCHFRTRNDEYKRSCHESSIRVPTAFIGPGFDGGGRIVELVDILDLPPTLLDAAGLPVPDHMQGRSIRGLIGAGTTEWKKEVLIQVSEAEVGRALRTMRWKYGVTAPDADPLADAGSSRYRESYLYDLAADPYELKNLIGLPSHAEVAHRLRERLRQRMLELGEAAPEIVAATERPAEDQRHVFPHELP